MEGFKYIDGNGLKPKYRIVGFYLGKGGGKVGSFNASRDEKDSCLIPLTRVLLVIYLVPCLVLGRVNAPTGICAYHG